MVETREDLPEEASDFDKEEVKSAKEVADGDLIALLWEKSCAC